MNKKHCIVHANCQGEPLIERLNTSPQFAGEYTCTLFTNYTREDVPDEALHSCSLFLYQYLGPQWDALASENLLDKLPEGAQSLCIPNMFFKGYWPFWDGKAGFDYRCALLDDVLEMDLSPEETTVLYLGTDVDRKHDLLDLVSQTIERERERQAHTPINYLDLLVEKYRETKLFNTINHPGSLLMNHVAREILAHLGMEPPNEQALHDLGEPFPEFELPINPKIGNFFGWDFAATDAQYQIYGRKMSFARFVANYVMARKAGIDDFIGFLQGKYIGI